MEPRNRMQLSTTSLTKPGMPRSEKFDEGQPMGDNCQPTMTHGHMVRSNANWSMSACENNRERHLYLALKE